jgi:hypothetical protein
VTFPESGLELLVFVCAQLLEKFPNIIILGADVPIRVLCLHGKGESGGSFCYNTEFLDDFEDGALEVRWEYVNAPHSTPYDALAFEWWKLPPGERSFTATTYEGALHLFGRK